MSQESSPKKPLTIAKIMNVEYPTEPWTPFKYHCVSPRQLGVQARVWTIIPGKGVQVRGETGLRRSPGDPVTVERIIQSYGSFMEGHVAFFDPALVYAVIANESRGKEVCERFEERISDYSFGLGQFLTNTAHGLLQSSFLKPPDVPIPKGGSKEKWREFLCQAKNCFPLIRSYLVGLNRRFDLKGDPVLIYAAYNAGSPRPSKSSPWGLVHHGPALDNISEWYGDACFLLSKKKPAK